MDHSETGGGQDLALQLNLLTQSTFYLSFKTQFKLHLLCEMYLTCLIQNSPLFKDHLILQFVEHAFLHL